MQLLFEKREVMDVVEGIIEEPKDRTSDAWKQWKRKESEAKYCISATLDDRLIKHVLTCKNSKEMWNTLCGLFEKRSAARIMMLQKRILNFKLEAGIKVSDYVAEAKNLAHQLQIAGEAVSDEMLQTIILNGLPLSKYKSFVLSWNGRENTSRSLQKLEEELISAEEIMKTEDEEVEALAVATMKKSSHKKTTKEGMEKNKHNKFSGKCYFCEKIGHKKENCRKFAESKNKTKSTDKKKIKAQSSEHSADQDDGLFFARASTAETNVVPNEEMWLADSGASFHMSFDKSIFEKLEKSEHKSVLLGDNRKLKVFGKGDVQILVLQNGKWIPWKLTNVLCVPELRNNLFSYSACTSHGYEIISSQDNIKIVKNKEVKASGTRYRNLYKMHFKNYRDAEVNSTQNEIETKIENLRIWHEKLGHASLTTMEKIAANNSSIGLKKEELQKFTCEACIFAKAQRKVFKSSTDRQCEVGEVVHSDVCGPFPTTAYNGARYFVRFKDDASEYRCIYSIAYKSEVVDKSKEYANMVRNRFDKDIKILKSDNGREFVNIEMQKFCRSRGIEHQTTAPYNPEQNGKAERDIRTITEMIRAMIFGRNLPKKLWSEAVSMAAFILNRSTTSKSNKTPYERWFLEKPDLSKIRVFGSTAYAHVPENQRQKLDPKANKLLFVGYQGNSNNYRLIDLNTYKLTIATSVKFIDGRGNFNFQKTVGAERAVIENLEDSDNEDQQTQPESAEKKLESAKRESDYSSDEDDKDNKTQRTLRDRSNLKQPDRWTYPQANLATIEPKSYEEAIAATDARQWKKAIGEEIAAHQKHGTWIVQEKPINKKTVSCKWIFKRKVTPGESDRYKARLVARGFSQKYGIDYLDTYAPVVRYDSIRVLLAMAVAEEMEILQFDVKTAFLYGELKEEIWIELPEGPWQSKERVVKLQKSLYGLKQSPHCWNERLNNVLTEFNLQRSDADDCIYVGSYGADKIYLALYVDDGLVFCKSKNTLRKFLNQIGKVFDIKISEPRCFVGLEIERDRDRNWLKIHQASYTQQLIERFNMKEAKGMSIPVDPHTRLSKEMSPNTQAGKEEMDRIPYASLVGSLLFAANVTRFDIAFGVNVLSRYLQNPGLQHWKAAKRILRYLKETETEGITYSKQMGSKRPVSYSDADFAGDEDERRSTSGYIIILQGGPVSWSSRLQKTISLSTAEAELVAATKVAQELMWLRKLLANLQGIEEKELKPILLNCDNQAAISLTKNPGCHQRTKHIDKDYWFVRKVAENEKVEIQYCPTEIQLADILTKGLTKARFWKLKQQLQLNHEELSGSVMK